MTKTIKPLNIVFVHPDLGIGGAERLVIDAAVGLQSLGHKVTILTSYRDKGHCFEEARNGVLDVRVRGDAIFPPSIAGRFSILLSILRQISLTVSTGIWTSELRTLDPDVFIIDQLSACIPLFRLLRPKARILFYGHYPDRLLISPEKGSVRGKLKRIYRVPFDAIEGWSTACSDSIVVNSKYTRNVFKKTFPKVGLQDLKVIYPCVDTDNFQTPSTAPIWPDKKVLLSINRFETKKNLDLAVKAYAGLPATERSKAKLVLAGGYDPRNVENAACHKHLQGLATSLELTHVTIRPQHAGSRDLSNHDADLLFLLSIPNDLKLHLLHSSSLLLYTPENEHFGIVPLEAMLAGLPVLATNTGGPLETIYNDRTGFHRSPHKVEEWTAVMRKPLIPSSVENLKAMGQRGRNRVLAEFSQRKMTEAFDKELQCLVRNTEPRPAIFPTYILISALALIVLAVAVIGGIVGLRVTRG